MALLGLDTPVKKGIFVLYMALWSTLRLTVYGSQRNHISYDQTALLIVVCLVKLAMAVGMYLRSDGSFKELVEQAKSEKVLFLKYFLPAASYVVYDNLTFLILHVIDPVTYVVLMQMRLPATGVFWCFTVGKGLNWYQWSAIAMLTAACMIQKSGASSEELPKDGMSLSVYSTLLIAMQISCGVFSSVVNEYLLKEKGTAGVNLQNIFMYIHSFIVNVLWVFVLFPLYKGGSPSLSSFESLFSGSIVIFTVPIILILSSIGIVTSIFIKHLDSVKKTIASAMEIFVDTFFAFFLFGVGLGFKTALATSLAAASVVLYSKQPPKASDHECPTPPAGRIFCMNELMPRDRKLAEV
eukprot:TRINITY_DN33587_c0_g1_i1.p1 TRINITY_DN33587_c0_g1~~TRINITY_DN33587_c0_g1_i1.p1  ORF type:complete len:353 (+),score=76.64 TRINITY_DN33587_c0_g1_i1:47-1105(+)